MFDLQYIPPVLMQIFWQSLLQSPSIINCWKLININLVKFYGTSSVENSVKLWNHMEFSTMRNRKIRMPTSSIIMINVFAGWSFRSQRMPWEIAATLGCKFMSKMDTASKTRCLRFLNDMNLFRWEQNQDLTQFIIVWTL